MSINIFGWLRNKVRDAVLGGIQEALESLQSVKEGSNGVLLLGHKENDMEESPRRKAVK